MIDGTPARIVPQPWMTARATRRLLGAFARAGIPVRFVGGAVRDALLGRTVTDVDLATPALPNRVLALLRSAGIKAVPTGLTHGTVTAVVPPRHFEITTLRIDVEPQGRHARVAFTEDWEADARRRDFTVNALSLDADGRIYDYVGGLKDLKARRIRFVGDPETRIREDVLRLLRFYRFQAQLGLIPADRRARAACRALAPLLPTLSAERVWSELKKLLTASDPLPTLRLMQRDGVLARVVPEARRLRRVQGLLAVEPAPDPVLRLAALTELDREGATGLARRLRFSNLERDRLVALAAPAWPLRLADDKRGQRRALFHLGALHYRDLVLLRAAELGARARRQARALLAFAERTSLPRFPLRGRDVVDAGVAPGPRVAALLKVLASWWEEGDFRATRAACLAQLRKLAADQAPVQ
jgi:poly(A) polymerase